MPGRGGADGLGAAARAAGGRFGRAASASAARGGSTDACGLRVQHGFVALYICIEYGTPLESPGCTLYTWCILPRDVRTLSFCQRIWVFRIKPTKS